MRVFLVLVADRLWAEVVSVRALRESVPKADLLRVARCSQTYIIHLKYNMIDYSDRFTY